MHLQSVVQHGSINRASLSVGLSQPALSRSINRLEESLGIRLLERTPRGIAATPFCEELLQHLRLIHEELARADSQLSQYKEGKGGRMVIGASMGALNWLIADVVAEFERKRTGISIRIIEAMPSSLTAMLRVGELDIVVMSKSDELPEPDLIGEVIGSDRVDLCVGQSNPLVGRDDLVLRELAAKQQWILPTRAGSLRASIDNVFQSMGIEQPQRLLETSSANMLRGLLDVTPKIAVTTSQTLRMEIRSGRVVQLKGDWKFPRTKTMLFLRPSSTTDPLVAEFAGRLKQHAIENYV